jgi:hypothetical protein
MSNKNIEFRYSVYDGKDLEPSDITYSLPLSEDANFEELQKHFKRFLKAVGIK